jgi:uncharacterized RDD family membrane protein YckC
MCQDDAHVSDLKVTVTTPERVGVDLPLAGIGFRGMAYLIDAALLLLVAMAIYFVYSFFGPTLQDLYAEMSSLARALGLVLLFLALWGYWTIMEVLWHGQTVGKRLVGIRVVRSDGAPVTAVESALRNLLRLVDFFPACYPVGLITMLVDRQHRRLGDLVAGTVLIREEAFDLSRYEKVVHAPAGLALLPEEIELLTGYLSRVDALDADARLRIGRRLARRLGVSEALAATLDQAQVVAALTQKLGGT